MSKESHVEKSIFTVIDLVMSPEKSSEIIKIDAVKFDVDKIDLYNTDKVEFSERFSQDVKPNTSTALKQLREFIGESRVITFSVDDCAYLLDCADKCGIDFSCGMSDVIVFAREIFGDEKRDFTLRSLAEYFGVPNELRNAELIASVCIKLIAKGNGIDTGNKSARAVYSTPLYREILRAKDLPVTNYIAESEILVLQKAELDEAFMMLIDILSELNRHGIAYKTNGAINTSMLAYSAGITDTFANSYDYYFSRFVNQYNNESIRVPHLSVSVDIEPRNVEKAIELMCEYLYHYPTDKTLFTVQTAGATKLPEEYAVAERYNKSVLDIMVNPSIELERFTALKKSAAQAKEITNKEVVEYVQKTPIKVFDNAEKYLAVLSAIKPSRTDDIAFAVAVCERDAVDVLDEIVKFRQDRQSGRPDDIAAILRQSGGVFMYQEQGMRILCELSGCSQFYADNIRRAMAKHDIKALEQYKQAFLFGGVDIDGVRFGGCVEKDRMVSGRNYFAELCDKMPMLYLKAHARARAKFFIDCAKAQMQSEN